MPCSIVLSCLVRVASRACAARLLGLTGRLRCRWRRRSPSASSSLPVRDGAISQSEWVVARRESGRSGRSLVVLGLLLKLGSGLLVLLADLVELLHVLEEVGAPLEGDEELGLLGVAALGVGAVAGGLDGDGLGSDLLECSVVVSATR